MLCLQSYTESSAKVLLSVENPYVVEPSALLPPTPQQIHPDLAKERGMPCTPSVVEGNTPMEFPAAMPIRIKFYWQQVSRQSAVHVTSHQILQWKQNPELLQQGQVFIAKVDGLEEAFKVIALLTVGKDRIFYIQFVEDDEAIAFSSDDFFEMLREAKQVK